MRLRNTPRKGKLTAGYTTNQKEKINDSNDILQGLEKKNFNKHRKNCQS